MIYNPVSGECFYAEHGKGAFLNGTPLPLRSVEKKLSESIAGVEIKYLRSGKLASRMNTLAPFGTIRSMGSSTLDWCYLASGRYDIYIHGGQKLWDYAAGALIFEEAGGNLSTLEGDDFWSGEHVSNAPSSPPYNPPCSSVGKNGYGRTSKPVFNKYSGIEQNNDRNYEKVFQTTFLTSIHLFQSNRTDEQTLRYFH